VLEIGAGSADSPPGAVFPVRPPLVANAGPSIGKRRLGPARPLYRAGGGRSVRGPALQERRAGKSCGPLAPLGKVVSASLETAVRDGTLVLVPAKLREKREGNACEASRHFAQIS